ncbi:hypothetical protein PanWU01x14_110550 [Parasponia andersonii]|uniref:Uncharacterized protein n=1 Tax=Parasponia andersonii TaxID=3476 RepID=A0A2P5CZC1_PARAD|nr:hypothetical protein PanWU01x14_110550 [Parasponia andersonii]
MLHAQTQMLSGAQRAGDVAREEGGTQGEKAEAENRVVRGGGGDVTCLVGRVGLGFRFLVPTTIPTA